MRAVVDRMWTQLREYLGKMSRGSRIRLAVLSVLVIGLAILTVALFSQTTYVTMYTAQDQTDLGNVQAALREMGVSPRIEGLRVLVPEERANELRAELSRQGVLGPGSPDLSIGQGAAGFAVTDSHARWLYAAQRAEDIRKALLLVPGITGASVVVNPGETSPFRIQSGVRAPTAAVMVEVRGGVRLTNQEAQTIAEHVKAAVPGIEYENISIIDTNLTHYKIGDTSMDFGTEVETRLSLKNMLSGQIQAQVEQLLTPIFGMSNVEITPRIELNFDKVITESISFFPPVAGELDGIVRSSHDLWEAQRRDDVAAGIPGTDSNAMGTVEYPYGTLADGEQYLQRISERNYDINQTTEVIERAQGTIEFLSIAVVINEAAVEEDYTEQVRNLVTRGLGILPANVSVERMPFTYKDTSAEDARAAIEQHNENVRRQELIQTIIMWSVVLLLGIVFLLLVRTVVRAVKPPPEPEPVLVGMGIDYIADDDDLEAADLTEVIEEVELHKKSTGLEQIERFIDKDPAAVAQLLRNWLSDD